MHKLDFSPKRANRFSNWIKIDFRPKKLNLYNRLWIQFDLKIGKMANIALEAEVEDVNSDLKVLNGTKLKLTIHHSNSSCIVYCL